MLIFIGVWYCFYLPDQLFNAPRATVIESNQGELLGAKIASDGQWRFPSLDSVPKKFEQCIIQFEDAHFYEHPGFNPFSIFNAIQQNWKAGKVVRGGSTLTQQVVRLSRKNKQRTYSEKLYELVLATRMELKYSKSEILNFYASNAPFGGNVVGLEAAAWRYFGRSCFQLSWAESATLAVLPNAPGLIYPGKNQKVLLEKRNRLLKKLHNQGIIDAITLEVSIVENLPLKPFKLPDYSQHLLERIALETPGKKIKTSIDLGLQLKSNRIIKKHYNRLKQNEIYNAAILVLDVKSRKVLSYVGNTPTDIKHEKNVDVITKPRSTGSILKPFLYAAALDAGVILPQTLLDDVPTQIGRYKPINYDKNYDGLVKANEALSRSLNVPAVKLLQDVGLERFYDYLIKTNQKAINKGSNHYGLSLILGGAETSLWDLCKSYAAMANVLNNYEKSYGSYYEGEFAEPTFLDSSELELGKKTETREVFDAGSIFLTLEALKGVKRPEEEGRWELFNSTKQIAWKTGTSHGFRDAWAIGTTKDYVVGVWVGNADGEGRPGLTGVKSAAPIMFDVFGELPTSSWFNLPYDELDEVAICETSGHRAGHWCLHTSMELIQHTGLRTEPCPYHKLIHLDKEKQFRVDTSCEPLNNINSTAWFIIPPLQAHFYKKKNPNYKNLPPIKEGCNSLENELFEFIYPRVKSTIVTPKNFDEEYYGFIAEVAHNSPEKTLFWYLDETYIGTTESIHQKELFASLGYHNITVSDAEGKSISERFEIVK